MAIISNKVMELVMEEDHKSKHMCKFCSKIFPCGRSLGGHMRSHLITISSTEKKLPPVTAATEDLLPDDAASYGLRENPRKTRKFSDKTTLTDDDDAEKLCKECGKAFHSWKALFGHMKSHSKEDESNSVSWQSSNDHSKSIDDEAAPFCKKKKKKRSERTKRYTTCTNSEQEEVAMSLILLSMDYHTNSATLSHNNTASASASASVSDTRSSSCDQRKLFMIRSNGSETEVNSPKSSIQKKGPFESDHTKKRKKKKKLELELELSIDCKFKCIICNKAFASYQALGGHRASHKKFKGCCAPVPNEANDHDNNHNLEECKKAKEHECPICFKIFQSGQALGGHKRSHLIITDEAKNSGHAAASSVERRRIVPEVRGFLDLNLPAPLEDDCNEFKSSSYSYLQFLAY